MSKFNRITTNLACGPSIRYETLENRKHAVVPCVMLQQGVWPGSDGPLYYGGSVLGNRVQSWDHKPVVVYHPQMNGIGVSACDPVILNTQKVGLLLNTQYEDATTKLKTEVWLDVDRCNEVDPRIMEALTKNEKMESSTGLFSAQDDTAGDYNGTVFNASVLDMTPDHLAILPDQVGAMSVKDGGGLLQNKRSDTTPLTLNELSQDNIRDGLRTAIRAKVLGDNNATEFSDAIPYPYIMDVYTKFFVYELGTGLWKMDYSANDSGVTISGTPTQVVRVTEYRSVAGDFVGNATIPVTPRKEHDMTKEQRVAGLIANTRTKWEAADKDFLMTLNEDVLAKFEPEEVPGTPGTSSAPAAAPAAAPVANATTAPAAPVNMTPQQYMESLPAGPHRDMIMNGLALHNQQRTEMIGRITGNAKNTFTAEQLGGMDFAMLTQLANLAGPAPTPSYEGAGGFFNTVPLVANAAANEAPLAMPSMWGDSAK